ncbi:MAG: glycine zipper 2TM domain-containing protein [Alphaproteobacteria bacterium]|nr:glycine zipper 2TM domain-containing protein [Alphaproteobacteria bacterium]
MSSGRIALTLALGLALGACANDTGPKETLGTLIGAGVGGLLGSTIGSGSGQLAAVAGGTLLGAFLGNEIGGSLDRADQSYADQTAQRALETSPSGQTNTWNNPDSGHSGTLTPEPAYTSAAGEQCREYQQTVTVGSQIQEAYGTACRQADGTWKIVN